MPEKKTIAMFAVLCLIALGLGYWVGQPKQTSRKENGGNPEGKGKVKSEVTPKEPEFLKKGLVTYYPFNGNAKDESGNGNGGDVNGAILTTDRHGNSKQAYDFDGVDDKITASHKAFLNAFPITVSTWVKFQNRKYHVIVNKYLNRSFIGYFLDIRDNGKPGFSFLNNHPSSGSVGGVLYVGYDSPKSNDLSDGSWHQLAFSVDKIKGVLFVDGKKILAMPIDGVASKPNTNQPLSIGGGGGMGKFNGQLDDVRIYNRALSEAEVKAFYEWEKPKAK